MLVMPNPSSGETTISIETGEEGKTSVAETEKATFDETAEWTLEIFDSVQNLKEKKTKLKGESTTINTQSWNEGVYLLRALYKNEIITEKLVVKK